MQQLIHKFKIFALFFPPLLAHFDFRSSSDFFCHNADNEKGKQSFLKITLPISYGETMAGLMNLKNITVPTEPILLPWALGNLLHITWYKQWHIERNCDGKRSDEEVMESKTVWVILIKLRWFTSISSCFSVRIGSTSKVEVSQSALSMRSWIRGSSSPRKIEKKIFF